MQTKIARILVQLDALFDTRCGTVARMDVEKAAGLLHDPAYTSRLWDKFPGVDEDVYADLYANRDVKTLAVSQTTPVVGIIRDFVRRCAETSYSQPVALVPEVHLNFHPYTLTEAEEDFIIDVLQRVVPLKPLIVKCNFSLDQLNPMFVRNNYNTMVLYDGYEWLETHSKNKLLEEYRCEKVTLFTPAILNKMPEGTKLPENLREHFYSFSIFAQFFVNLTFIGIDNYCSFLSRKVEVVSEPDKEEEEPEETTEPQEAPPEPGVEGSPPA